MAFGFCIAKEGVDFYCSHGSSLEMLLVKLSGRRDFSAYLFPLCLSWAAWLNERFMICSTASRVLSLLLGINYIVVGSCCVTGMERGQGDMKDEALRKRAAQGVGEVEAIELVALCSGIFMIPVSVILSQHVWVHVMLGYFVAVTLLDIFFF